MSTSIARSVTQLPAGHWHPLPDARRAPPADLAREVREVAESPIVGALLDAVDAVLLVLNSRRQVLAFNGRGVDEASAAKAVGLRPGEVIGCENARVAGCGTAPACHRCGALGAILASGESSRPVEADCHVQLPGARGLDLHVRAAPVTLESGRVTVLSLRDVSAERRRDALEQVFFHDVLNTVAGLRGWAARLRSPGADHARAGERIDLLTRHVEREIRDQRALALAERGALVPERAAVPAAAVLADLEAIFSSHAAARGRTLEIAAAPEGAALETDSALLVRVLVNMVRNALEAVPDGGRVRVRCARVAAAARGEPEELRFAVWNEGAMPREVQARVFQRAFSTKAERGRGLGTWGMRLLGEGYLGGEVAFESTPERGTTFWIQLPVAPAARNEPTAS